MLGLTVLYNYPGQKTPKGRAVIETVPAIVMKEHEDGSLDLMVVRSAGVLEPRTHVRPLSKRTDKDLTEADFWHRPMTAEEAAAAKKAARDAEIAAVEAKLKQLKGE